MSYKQMVKTRLENKEKRICIFTNYRTGSTTRFGKITYERELPPLGEYFRTSKIGYGDILPYEKAFRNFNSMDQFILKLMANHVDYDVEKISNILNRCDKIIYLYRKDFKAQALSWLAAVATNSYADFKKPDGIPISITVPLLKQDFIDKQVEMLKNNYITMGKFYKQYPGEVLCLEDLETKTPYTRQYIWTGEKPEIPYFDVERAIFSNEMD